MGEGTGLIDLGAHFPLGEERTPSINARNVGRRGVAPLPCLTEGLDQAKPLWPATIVIIRSNAKKK